MKVLKSIVGLYPSIWDRLILFLLFIGLAIVGNKLVCGWACPFGALQELLYSLPILKRIKRRKVPFGVSNLIRALLFVLMLLMLFGVVGGRKGFVIYHFLNPFNLFNLYFEALPILITTAVALVLAQAAYRPFCQFVCPFGFISWLAERLSLMRVRINPDLCNKCGACVRVCPLGAAKDRVEGRLFGADCFSCARCLNVCAHDAITYGCVLSKRFPGLSVSCLTQRSRFSKTGKPENAAFFERSPVNVLDSACVFGSIQQQSESMGAGDGRETTGEVSSPRGDSQGVGTSGPAPDRGRAGRT